MLDMHYPQLVWLGRDMKKLREAGCKEEFCVRTLIPYSAKVRMHCPHRSG